MGLFPTDVVFYTYATVSNILLHCDSSYSSCEQHNKIVSYIARKFYCKEWKVELQSLELEGFDSTDMPPQLRSLIGVDFLFCVKISDFNFRSSDTSFTIVKTYLGDKIPTPETPPPALIPLEPSTSSTPSEELLTSP